MLNEDYVILIHKSLTGAIQSAEKKLLDEWLSSDPLNRDEFEEIKLIWDAWAEAEDGVEPLTDIELQRELKKLEQSIAEMRLKDQVIERWVKRNKRKNAIIAVLVFAAVAFAVLNLFRPAENVTVGASRFGYQETILPDSSRLLLNDSSAFSFRMNHAHREGTMTGEILFDVGNDGRPFLIHAGAAEITVTGTSFIVRDYPDEPLTVFVISGQVMIRHHDHRVMVEAGEMARVEDGGIVKSRNTDRNYNAWYTHNYVFDKTPLGDILRLLEKEYKASFYVASNKLLECRFSGNFVNADLKEVIQALSYSLNIEFVPGLGNHYTVSGKGCL